MAAGGKAKSGSGRLLVQTLAAHLARLADPADGRIAPHAIERQLLATLSGPPDRKVRHRYRDTLLGYGLVAARLSPEEAAQRYVDDVLRRRLQVARASPLQKAHEVLAVQCRRGRDAAWRDAAVARALVKPSAPGAIPSGFAAAERALVVLDKGITPKSPAEGTRARSGPIWLSAGSAAVEVAEELSVWHGLTSGPAEVTPFGGKGPAFDALCALTIQAVETANAHWSALLCLGLSPLDWAEAVSVNTAKKASAFRSAVREALDGKPDAIAAWRAAWAAHKVPGYADADAFWPSELGRALRAGPVGAVHLDIDEMDLADGMDSEARLVDALSFSKMVELARGKNVIDDYDAWFLAEIARGVTIDEVSGHIRTKTQAGGAAFDAPLYAAGLTRRLHAFARTQEPDTSEFGHPDSDSDD